MLALAVMLPTVAIAYLAAWRVAGEWQDRHRLRAFPWTTLWLGVILSTLGFGTAILWVEIVAYHLGHAPNWGLRVYAPAIKTVAALDVASLAVTLVNHAVVRVLNGRPVFRWPWDTEDATSFASDAASDLVEGMAYRSRAGSVLRPSADVGVADIGGSGPSFGSSGGSWSGPSGGSGGSWLGGGLDLGADEGGFILGVGVLVLVLAAILVTASLTMAAFVTYFVLRLHAKA